MPICYATHLHPAAQPLCLCQPPTHTRCPSVPAARPRSEFKLLLKWRLGLKKAMAADLDGDEEGDKAKGEHMCLFH